MHTEKANKAIEMSMQSWWTVEVLWSIIMEEAICLHACSLSLTHSLCLSTALSPLSGGASLPGAVLVNFEDDVCWLNKTEEKKSVKGGQGVACQWALVRQWSTVGGIGINQRNHKHQWLLSTALQYIKNLLYFQHHLNHNILIAI